MTETEYKLGISNIYEQFIESYGKLDPKKLGKLAFKYRGTHGLPKETVFREMDMFIDSFYKERQKEWKSIFNNGVEYAKELEREKYR